jgi:hypothetical protein
MTVGRIPVIECGIQPTIFDAKADLLTATANDTPARLAVGSNTAVLTADSTASTGLAWDGVWQNWTASITGITVGNGTVISRYRKVGKTVEIFFKFTMGSTSSLNAALNYFALPFNFNNSSAGGFAVGGISDVGTTDFVAFPEINGNNCILSVPNASGTYLSWTRVNNVVPMTWATNDFIWFSFTYEAS